MRKELALRSLTIRTKGFCSFVFTVNHTRHNGRHIEVKSLDLNLYEYMGLSENIT